jgi:hypothetical protein
VAAAIAVSLALAGSANASVMAFGVWNIKDTQTGRCLDSNTAGSLYTLPCVGGRLTRTA